MARQPLRSGDYSWVTEVRWGAVGDLFFPPIPPEPWPSIGCTRLGPACSAGSPGGVAPGSLRICPWASPSPNGSPPWVLGEGCVPSGSLGRRLGCLVACGRCGGPAKGRGDGEGRAKADKPRRPKFEPWEIEARDATERLRQALAQLLGLERAFHAGSVEDEELLERLRGVNATAGSVRGWWQEWQTQTAALRSSRAVALSVFRAACPRCPMPSTSTASRWPSSPSHRTSTPGTGTWPVGASTAKDVSLFALQLLDDTPALRSIDRAAVDATLEGLDTLSKPMLDLVEPIGARVLDLRNDSEN